MKPSDVVAYAKEKGARMLDLKFLDFPGLWQHCGYPIHHLNEGLFEDGMGFDGSSIRGWQPIHASDMLIVPDPGTTQMDPFTADPTLSLICNIVDPITREPYSRDPRNIAQKAERYLRSLGLADTAYFGPEAEFFVFDDVRYEQSAHHGFYAIDSVEGAWNSGREERPNLGYKGGDALVYAGGSSSGQVIRAVKIIEPRSWSALQLIQGHPSPAPPCSNALVEDNEIGPAGSSNETWADGISLACTNTTVRNNRIVDATDGGIVIFGAPGSLIEGNTIRAETRTLLGGINMVDFDPYEGNYTGTIVRNNTIEAAGAVIRIGLGMGPRVWGCWPADSDKTLQGAVVTGNILRGEKMQYGFVVDGVQDWTVTGNIDEALHSGTPSVDCRGQIASVPAGFQFYAPRAQGFFQDEFAESFLELALWAILSPRPGE